MLCSVSTADRDQFAQAGVQLEHNPSLSLSNHTKLFSMASSQSIANEKDGLFLERLDAFVDKTLLDAMRSFAIKEQRPLEQVRTGT